MRAVSLQLRPYFVLAGLFSLVINLLLLAPPLYMLQVFDRVLSSRSGETLLLLTLGVVIALLTMATLDIVRAQLLAAGGAMLDRLLGPQVLDGLLRQAAGRGEDGAHAAGLRDVSCLRGFFIGSGILALFDAPWLPVFLLIIFLFHPLMGALAIGGSLLMLALALLNERFTRRPLEQAQLQGRKAGAFIDVSVRNAEVVGALGMLAAVTRRWSRLNEAALAAQSQACGSGAAVSGLTKFARQLIQTGMLGAGAYLVVEQQVTAGVMIAATILLGRALAPVELLIGGWRGLVEARAAWRRLDELLANRSADSGTRLPAPAGRIEAERVTFGFPGAERLVIRGAAFELAPGESLGIIGPSASGKSTLVRLIVGAWKPLAGAVRLDGADVAAWPRASLGPLIGYLPQDVELFPGTVSENIARLDEPDAPAVIRAAQAAHVHELVLRLPKGYDTQLGEAGQALSPGQRQRIALARALYGDPRLVVLDEPNANLDHEGDVALLQTLRRMKEEGVTVVIVAHRPSLLSGVDKLLVLREGMVDAFGPREEIMARLSRNARRVREAA